MHFSIRRRLQTATRLFLALGFGVLSVYLVLANLSHFLAAFDLLDFDLLATADLVAVGAAVAAGIVGALVGRPRLERAEPVAEILVRYCVGFILPIYGATKILDVQFRLPFAALDTPLGEASGMALTWRFSGYSYAYELMVGLAEFGGALLLFFRRTTTLGACILLPVLANVAALNYTHNIPVKLYSTCYLLMVSYLIGLDFPRLSALFLTNRAFGPRPTREPPWPPRVANVLGYVKAGCIAFTVVYAFVFILVADNRPSAISGAWAVTRTEPQDSPAGAWKKVFFERDVRGVFIGSVKEADGRRAKRFRYEVSPDDGRLAIAFQDPSPGSPFTGSYEFLNEQTLQLTGDLGGERVVIVLTKRK
jgi:hypothetical protein